jgi:hypothetical protein
VVVLLKKVAASLRGVTRVSGEDEALHRAPLHGGWKPDLILWGRDDTPLLVGEYESLNSSDERVFEKDIWKYQLWASEIRDAAPPLLVITTLRNGAHPQYPSAIANYGYNLDHKGKTSLIRTNPFQYWYKVYRSKIYPETARLPITFANFSDKDLGIVGLDLKRIARENARRPPQPLTDRDWDCAWWNGGAEYRPSRAIVAVRRDFKSRLRGQADLATVQRLLREDWDAEQAASGTNCWTNASTKGFLKDVGRARSWQDAVRVIANVQLCKY